MHPTVRRESARGTDGSGHEEDPYDPHRNAGRRAQGVMEMAGISIAPTSPALMRSHTDAGG